MLLEYSVDSTQIPIDNGTLTHVSIGALKYVQVLLKQIPRTTEPGSVVPSITSKTPCFYDLWSRSTARAGIERVEKVSGLCCVGQRRPDSFSGHVVMRYDAALLGMAHRKTGRVDYAMTVLVFQFSVRRLHKPKG